MSSPPTIGHFMSSFDNPAAFNPEEHEAFRFRQKLQTESEFLHAQSVLLKQEREQLNRERSRLSEEHRIHKQAIETREKQLALKEDALEHRIHQEVKR
ncbi:hypothetical protein AHF37_01100 [Paragonimus kellicotti]|nr:hypothetical protein AHF37_01100 [Paragonimus kellicotti]